MPIGVGTSRPILYRLQARPRRLPGSLSSRAGALLIAFILGPPSIRRPTWGLRSWSHRRPAPLASPPLRASTSSLRRSRRLLCPNPQVPLGPILRHSINCGGPKKESHCSVGRFPLLVNRTWVQSCRKHSIRATDYVLRFAGCTFRLTFY